MALWRLTARRSSGFVIDLGVYGFAELDLTEMIREDIGKVTLKNREATDKGIVEIQFNKIHERRKENHTGDRVIGRGRR